jgi:hypothetical protein
MFASSIASDMSDCSTSMSGCPLLERVGIMQRDDRVPKRNQLGPSCVMKENAEVHAQTKSSVPEAQALEVKKLVFALHAARQPALRLFDSIPQHLKGAWEPALTWVQPKRVVDVGK